LKSFWDKVKRGSPEECWPWLGFKRPSGHGLTSYKAVPCNASRKAWILTHGPIEGDWCVNHRCDNAACCNPHHLYLGTRADNMMDMWLKTPPDLRGNSGRNCVLTDQQLRKLMYRRREGATLKECAAEFGVHVATVCRYITTYRKARLAKIRADRLSTAQK